jgi:hypothetical protein
MQVVRVEFVTDCTDAQEAVNLVEVLLPNLRNRNVSGLESWNVYWVDETVVTYSKVSHSVEDGKVLYNG